MLLRLPWLLTRRRLLVAVVIDNCLFLLLYIVAFFYCFGSWPGLSFPVAALITFWLLSSYVIGRYQSAPTGHGGQLLSLALCTGSTLFLSFWAYFAYLWIMSATLAARQSGAFMLPLLVIFAFFSCISQYILARCMRAYAQQPQKWLFLGTSDTFNLLSRHMAWRRMPSSLTLLTEQNQLHDMVGDYFSGVLLSDFHSLPDAQERQLLWLQQKGTIVLSVLAWCELVLQRFPPELLTKADLLRGEFALARSTTQLRLKRMGDLIFSGFLLLLTSPILIISALLIRLQDGGPMFYSQLRSGLDGTVFRIWKLRTMRVDAERHGAQWVRNCDVRITPLGRLLRLTRLDELPQLWAVLQGEMSLIGPRPERPEFEQDLERQIPHYRLRYLMRPGLSGWAQVNYPYGASLDDAAHKLSYDLYYLRNFSFWLDLLILFKTIRLVFNAQGAVPISHERSKP